MFCFPRNCFALQIRCPPHNNGHSHHPHASAHTTALFYMVSCKIIQQKKKRMVKGWKDVAPMSISILQQIAFREFIIIFISAEYKSNGVGGCGFSGLGGGQQQVTVAVLWLLPNTLHCAHTHIHCLVIKIKL